MAASEILSVARDMATVFHTESTTDHDPRTAYSSSHLPSPVSTPRLRHSMPPPLKTIPSGSETSSLTSSTSSPSSASAEEEEKNSQKGRSRASSSIGIGGTGNDAKTELWLRCKSRSSTVTGAPPSVSAANGARRLSVQDMQELERPDSLPVGPAMDDARTPTVTQHARALWHLVDGPMSAPVGGTVSADDERMTPPRRVERPGSLERTSSTPPTHRTSRDSERVASSPRRNSFHPAGRPSPLNLSLEPSALPPTTSDPKPAAPRPPPPPSPIPSSIPMPPMSLHTHLQLELAGHRPSPLYIHHSHSSDIPYESSAIKFERLKSVMMMPPYLERTLIFGALACLDAWLFVFTILPIRSITAVGVLAKWWGYVLAKEARWVVGFVWYGLGRLWARARAKGKHIRRKRMTTRPRSETETSDAVMDSISGRPPQSVRSASKISIHEPHPNLSGRLPHRNSLAAAAGVFRHRRTASQPSNLSSCNKADLLQGALVVVTSIALMWFDASRMYHFIRAQSAIKLYVIYNVLEVGDRLLSALGQDIFECLFSAETLSRNSSGRSKVLLPLGMFVLALTYNIVHSIALYYQVITLNVAINSYSNALLTLLLSNQFVEIKSTVFKRIEKDNLFQLTCADIVERFQLWIMLLIIALRNIVEVGGISVPGAGMGGGSDERPPSLHTASILPHSFTVLPSWISTGAVLSPFLIVTFSEVVVDTIKHAYVVKFNNIKPTFYGRILDIICKDYYTNAFTTPSLTRRLGLAVIPMACLFIRSSIQTYNMFLATNLPAPLPPSTQTSLATTSTATPSSAPFLAALDRFDSLLRDALGRSVYSHPYAAAGTVRSWWSWTSDDVVAATTMVVVFFILFVVLLIAKLVLGMVLLRYARNRYAAMKVKEMHRQSENYEAKGRRVGGFAQVEVPDDAKRWVNADPAEGLKRANKPQQQQQQQQLQVPYSGTGVERFEMVAKRIW